MFRERYNPRQQALFHVLAAYSVYNTEIGYCQGKLLLIISLFWTLTNNSTILSGDCKMGLDKLYLSNTSLERSEVLGVYLESTEKHLEQVFFLQFRPNFSSLTLKPISLRNLDLAEE